MDCKDHQNQKLAYCPSCLAKYWETSYEQLQAENVLLREALVKIDALLNTAVAYYKEYADLMMQPEQDDGTHDVEVAFVKAFRSALEGE